MGIGKFIKYSLMIGALVGATAYATFRYHDYINQDIAPRINYAAEKIGEIKNAFKKDFTEEHAVDKIQESYLIEKTNE